MLTHILDDRYKNRLVSEAIRMSKWNFNLHEWNKEKMDELVRDESERIDREEREKAVKEGHKEGRIEGIEQGEKQNTKDLIIAMHNNGASLDFISKVTNKNIEEINKIIYN